jgi:hypothetical protein
VRVGAARWGQDLYLAAGDRGSRGVRKDLRQMPHSHIDRAPGQTGGTSGRHFSLRGADQQFINNYGGRVPPLAGEVFLQRWGLKTAAQLVARFQEAKFSFEEAGLTDDESIVEITADVLQVNGAKPGSQRLTRTTDAIVSSATSNPGALPVR